MTSPAAADLARSRKPGEVGARFVLASRVTGEGVFFAARHAGFTSAPTGSNTDYPVLYSAR